MENLTPYTEQLLTLAGLDSSQVILGNSIGTYTLSLAVFLLGLVVFALAQYFALSWLASISKRTKTDLDDTFVKMVRSFRPPFYLFVSFWLAVNTLSVAGLAGSILTGVLVVWLVYQAVVVVGILVEDVVFRHFAKDQDDTTRSALHLLASIAKGIMWVLGILLILSNFGINVTSLMAGAGIAGIAVAFALQGILGDLFSSFSLYFDKPFKVGDFIVVGDAIGTVRHIGIKSTRIAALTGEEITVSNQELTSARIQNFKRMKERRAVFGFGILYETPVETVRKVPKMVQEIVEAQDKVRFDRARFTSFGDSSLDFEIVYYVLSPDYALYSSIQQEINLKLMERFEKENIGFAYPTRTLYMAKAD